jgi:hypothetical protein
MADKKEEKSLFAKAGDKLSGFGDYVNKQTTLSDETKKSIEAKKQKAKEELLKAKAKAGEWLKVTKEWMKVSRNRSMLLVAILMFMILLNFAVFMSINFDDLKKNDKDGDDARNKVGHLKNISIATFFFALLLGVNIGVEGVMKPVDVVITEI